MLHSKLYYLTVTRTELEYDGSITIDEDLMEAGGLVPEQKVQVLNLNNGARFETYVMEGEKNSGDVCLNGPAARLGQVGDRLIVIAYCLLDEKEIKSHHPKIVKVDRNNRAISVES